MSAAAPEFFVVGGTLPPGAVSYIARSADDELLAALQDGEYAYVLNSRQMGKSSLCVRTLRRLHERGVRTVFLDLTKFGAQNVTPEQWYAALLSETGRGLGCRTEMLRHWKENDHLGPMQHFFGALTEVGVPAEDSPLVAFVDEIDVTRSLAFGTDEFFAGIRQCFVARASDSRIGRLTFCLLGTATPAELIQDTRTSPFNIGQRVDLRDFTPEEARSLIPALGPRGVAVLARILYWTNGHPYLTQRLCRESVAQGVTGSRGVDALCDALFLSHNAREGDDNLAFVRNRLLKSEADPATLLDLVGKLSGRGIPDDEGDPTVGIIKMSGVARLQGGRLVLRNRIYARVFDRAWVESQLPGAELRRQKEAYRRGVRRTALIGVAAFASALAVWGYVTFANMKTMVAESFMNVGWDQLSLERKLSRATADRDAALIGMLFDAGRPKPAVLARRFATTNKDIKDDPKGLSRIAWAVVRPESALVRPDYSAALVLARRAAELTQMRDEAVLDTYARALAKTGNWTQALDIQTRITEEYRRAHGQNPSTEGRRRLLTRLEAHLAEYRRAAPNARE